MNVLSLFAGIGGLELGLERAGMTVVGQVEIDPFCRKVLAKHWPEVPRHDDVRTCVDWWRSVPRAAVHVVAGGFPCQPVSVAGRQRAQRDERWLWPAFAHAIRELRPEWVLLENVPGLLGRGMGDVLGDLAACGYDAEWDCIPAVAVGAHHRRDRVFAVAYPSSVARGLQPVAESGGCGKAVIGDDGSARPMADAAGPRHTSRTSGEGRSTWDETRWAGPDGLGGDVADPHGERRWQGPGEFGGLGPAQRGQTMADADGQRRARRSCLPQAARSGGWLPPQRGDAWRAEPDVGRVAHGVPARVDRLRALGNAVVPQVAEHIGRLIVAADQGLVPR